jgi:hypothetical protein
MPLGKEIRETHEKEARESGRSGDAGTGSEVPDLPVTAKRRRKEKPFEMRRIHLYHAAGKIKNFLEMT